MKKTMITLALTFFGLHLVFAQGNYFRFGIGYGLPSGSQMMGVNFTSTMSSGTVEGVYGSLGSGLTFNTSYAHMYSKNFGLDLSLQYLLGKKYESNDTFTYDGSTSSIKSSIYSRGIIFSPEVIMTVGENKVKPYVQMGIVMGKVKVWEEANGTRFEEKSEYRGGLSFGFKGGFGVDAAISENASFFTELAFTSMSYYPKEGTTTSKVDGTTQPNQPKVEFVKEITTNASTANSSKQLRYSEPFGSVVLSAGLKFRLKGKSKE